MSYTFRKGLDPNRVYAVFNSELDAENYEKFFRSLGWTWCCFGGYMNAFESPRQSW